MVSKVADGTYPDVHSILVARNGKLVVEEYFYEYDRTSLHSLRSATKPFISALVGIALGKGLISDIDEPVNKFIPDYQEKTTLRDLLTLQSEFACDRATDSCFRDAATLGRVIENVSHQSLAAFAKEHLFEPMGISQYKWNFRPSDAASDVFHQLYLCPRDILKFGMLFLNNGQWNGKQVVPPGWVRESLSKQSEVNNGDYGYLWWLRSLDVAGQKYEGCVARGNGGQRIFLFPKYNLLAVITGGSFDKASSSDVIMSNYILAGLKSF
jgi:CubicO group peptidase (beta-lactamase class C family)